MGHIHPGKLKLARESRNLSQSQLAAASGVSQKQISRLETPDTNDSLKRCQGTTLTKLASALGMPGEDLAKAPEGDLEAKAEELGLKRVWFYLSMQDRLHYRFLEAKYGVKAHDIVRAAPLLFMVTAEMSLAERRERLSAFEEALNRVPGDSLFHLGEVRIGISRVEEAVLAERQSVSECDLSGETIQDDEWSQWYEGSGDLFVDFLERKARELAPDAMGFGDEISGSFSSLRVELFQRRVEELSDGNPLAQLALESGDVHPRDIPGELMADDQAEARVEWLAERCSEDTRRAYERRMAKTRSNAVKL